MNNNRGQTTFRDQKDLTCPSFPAGTPPGFRSLFEKVKIPSMHGHADVKGVGDKW